MRWLLILALASLVTVSLAGCSGKDKDSTTTLTSGTTTSTGTTSSGSTATTSPSSTTTSGASSPQSNHAPTGSLSASVPAGAVPLAVNFTLTGSDADGDALTWTLSFGDATTNATGTAVPATVAHNYALSGNFTVQYLLTDGKESASYNVTIKATLDAGAPAVVTFTGHVDAPSPSYNTEGECLEPIIMEPLGFTTFGQTLAVDAANYGWAYAFDTVGMTAIFYNADLSQNLQEGPTGTVPDGAVSVIVCSEMAIDADWVLTFTAPA